MPYSLNDGVRIYYEVEGHGLPLVLLHGLGENLNIWRELSYVDSLKKDYALILIDARGHGTSDKPQGPELYNLKLTASDVIAVLDELKIEKAHFMGFSVGGWIGFGVAKYFPNRLNSLIVIGMNPYQTEPGETDLAKVLGALDLPILLLVGEDDSFFSGAKEFSQNFPNVKLISFPEVGHFGIVFQAQLTLPLVNDFLVTRACAEPS